MKLHMILLVYITDLMYVLTDAFEDITCKWWLQPYINSLEQDCGISSGDTTVLH